MPHQHLSSRQPSLHIEGLHNHQQQLMNHSHRHNASLPSGSYLDGASNGFGSVGSTPSASVVSLASDTKQPLPSGWDVGQDYDGKVYFIDHVNKKTTWEDPRDSFVSQAGEGEWLQQQQQQQQQHQLQQQQLGDYCNVQRLQEQQYPQQDAMSLQQQQPEQAYQQQQQQQQQQRLEDWRHLQEDMLRQYLATAESDLKAKKELADVKQQRLHLAQDEYQHLAVTLQQAMSASSTSCDGSPDLRIHNSSPAVHHQQRQLQQQPQLRRHSSANSSFSECMYQNQSQLQQQQQQLPASAGASPISGGARSSYNSCSSFSASQSSLNSTGSAASGSVTSTSKYDPDLLKSDVQLARARVQRLKRELADIDQEMGYKQRGLETLAQVSAKYSPASTSTVQQQQPQQQQPQQLQQQHQQQQHSQQQQQLLTLEEAQAIRAELLNIQRSLTSGEQEKQELMRSLACLKDDLIRLQHSESSFDVSALNPLEKFSTASQTDLSGEMVPVGTRLAEMARLRLQYDEARRNVQDIQQSLASMEERMNPGQLESDKDRLLLIQDKEQLLRELRAITPRSRSSQEMSEVKSKIQKLERDLDNAMEVSNRCISDRLKLHEEKQLLLQQLRDGMRTVSRLETQLRQLSATTLSSTSSSSSLGSLSSSHASSKGSLSSLSFTDIYGLSTTTAADPAMLDLHKRVDKILNNPSTSSGHPSPTAVPMLHHPLSSNQSHNQTPESGMQSAEESLTTPDSETGPNPNLPTGHSQPSLSPRSSLSSVSPPVSPQQPEAQQLQQQQQHLPPSYEHAYLGSVERQRRIQQHLVETKHIVDQLAELGLSKSRTSSASKLTTIAEAGSPKPAHETAVGLEVEQILNQQYGGLSTAAAAEPSLSPICEVESLPSTSQKAVTASTVVVSSSLSAAEASAAVSDESVAGDSGVYEAVTRTNRGASGSAASSSATSPIETSAQVQIKLRYSKADSLLHIGIEKARNLGALFIPENRKICVKASLLPHPGSPSSAWTFCTRSISNLQKPSFGEHFPLAVSKSSLSSKTLQVTIWAVKHSSGNNEGVEVREECLGSSQVSLADFDCDATSSVVRWYNVLSFRFMQQPGEGKERGKKVRAAGGGSRHRLAHHQQVKSDSAASSKQGTLKEESSDESTIISSQASTLTRDNAGGHEAALVAAALIGELQESADEDEEEDDDEEEEDDQDDVVIPTLPEVMDSLEAISASQRDQETNTECVFVVPSGAPWNAGVASPRRPGGSTAPPAAASALIRRSQTFSPAGLSSKNDYTCKLNRSDSDSAMSLHKRVAFQKERRSLRVPKANSLKVAPMGAISSASKMKEASSSSKSKKKSKSHQSSSSSQLQTPLDLELDLAAQQAKLQLLQEEIERLKDIKSKMEEAKVKGAKEMPSFMQENDKFHQMLTKLQTENQETPSAEEKKVEKMLRKTSRDIYRLRKTRMAAKGQPDMLAFKEKMAFFTTMKNDVPMPMEEELEEEEEERSSTLKFEEGKRAVASRVTVTHMSGDSAEKVVTLGSSSTETVDTITAEEEEGEKEVRKRESKRRSGSSKSKGRRSKSEEENRFSYEIDPDIGVIV